jgi:hypothetical protein
MSVTKYLEHARVCAEIADRLARKDKTKLMDIADAWLKLAHEEAKHALASQPHYSLSDGVKALDEDRLNNSIRRKEA